ncbi:unnamed protein product [Owenia fusiformis]|uniref:N-acetylgalactosaminide beta-1,3-galactosyltransferase n=1 Tax=Owenia fusiformis TaxID=6347 RepID=A0A8J1THA7_OWEFU|nr:unnamed protein product [Owenia fusiformis]
MSKLRIILAVHFYVLLICVIMVLFFKPNVYDVIQNRATDIAERAFAQKNQTHKQISKHYKILCWIMTSPTDLEKRTKHVRDTWAKHCDIDLYMSSQENTTFPTVGLNVTEGRAHISMKSKAAWTFIYENYLEKADYFLKGDPDTFIVVENLRRMLQNYNPNDAEIFGHMFYLGGGKHNVYMAGGPGIVASRESLKRMVEIAFRNSTWEKDCFPDGDSEDFKSCNCMIKAGAKPINCTDELGRERFLVYPPHTYIQRLLGGWYTKAYNADKGKNQGPNCCSEYPIGFHYIGPSIMYDMYYYFYKTKVDHKFDKIVDVHMQT